MWNLIGVGVKPMSLALAGGFLTAGPPGSPVCWFLSCFDSSSVYCIWSKVGDDDAVSSMLSLRNLSIWLWLLGNRDLGGDSGQENPCYTLFSLSLAFKDLIFYLTAQIKKDLWDLSSLTKDWTRDPAVKAPSPNHWTTRESPPLSFLTQIAATKTLMLYFSLLPSHEI